MTLEFHTRIRLVRLPRARCDTCGMRRVLYAIRFDPIPTDGLVPVGVVHLGHVAGLGVADGIAPEAVGFASILECASCAGIVADG